MKIRGVSLIFLVGTHDPTQKRGKGEFLTPEREGSVRSPQKGSFFIKWECPKYLLGLVMATKGEGGGSKSHDRNIYHDIRPFLVLFYRD